MQRLRQIANENESTARWVFDVATQLLISVSLVALAVETLPDLSPSTKQLLHTIELLTIVCFALEYLLRLLTAPRRLGYALSFFGVIDLLAILPSLIGLGVDFRSLRVLRLLRVFRVLKLARYSQAVRRLHLALKIAWEELVLFGAVTAVLLFLSSVGIYEFEHHAQPEAFASIFHSFWWAVVTLTTVGYGDVYPITLGGRIFTLVVLVAGLGIVSIPPGLVASALSQAREIQKGERVTEDLSDAVDPATLRP